MGSSKRTACLEVREVVPTPARRMNVPDRSHQEEATKQQLPPEGVTTAVPQAGESAAMGMVCATRLASCAQCGHTKTFEARCGWCRA
jgi:hypothetical protein